MMTGLAGAVLASGMGLVMAPHVLVPAQLDVTAAERAMGHAVYRSEGCLHCHSQQVRPFGGDLERGWGRRRSLPEDLATVRTPLSGTMRTGPDLADIGWRQAERGWHHRHLYAPDAVSPGTLMPSYAHLYHVRPADAEVPAHAVPLEVAGHRVAWLIPSEEAEALVDYLLSLQLKPVPEEME